MNTQRFNWGKIGVSAQSTFFTANNGVEECHAMVHVEPCKDCFQKQLERLTLGVTHLMASQELEGFFPVMKRYFLSDAANQASLIDDSDKCAISFIQQPPLDGSKIGLWIYLQKGTHVYLHDGTAISEHNGYKHLYRMGMCSTKGDSAQQTKTLLEQYEADLQQYDATLADNCIRTWFFVRDVDTQYAGLVHARKENFISQGLTEHTHYISSTGIGGSPAQTKALVQLGAYAITGIQPGQQRYLYAATHLNPTYEYGVTFERGTVLSFGDREHVFISGTASINNKGDVVHVGDIIKQAHRMLENVETLLSEGGANWNDVMQIIVYLRDTADYEVIRDLFAEKFPEMPIIITLAPVCRPTWLVEMECIAVTAKNNPMFKEF